MPTKDPRREAHFPAIEKRYGEPMKHWFAVMKTVAGKRYPEQIAHLRENYGFSQAHANALVLFSRGSAIFTATCNTDGLLQDDRSATGAHHEGDV